MKKLTALLLAVLLVFGLAACAGSPAESNAKPGDTMTLQDILTSITKDVADLPDTETTALTKDNFEYFAFTAMPDGVEAIAADSLINAVPHSVVLMRAQDAETAKKLAADVKRKDVRAEVDADIAEGQRIGVQGTPYFLINNLVARGALSSDLFKEAINMALQAAPSGQK